MTMTNKNMSFYNLNKISSIKDFENIIHLFEESLEQIKNGDIKLENLPIIILPFNQSDFELINKRLSGNSNCGCCKKFK